MPTGPSTATRKTAKAAAAAPRSRGRAQAAAPTHEQIAERAYFLALEGDGDGELGDWLRAERELAG